MIVISKVAKIVDLDKIANTWLGMDKIFYSVDNRILLRQGGVIYEKANTICHLSGEIV
jgi:hypothetical protein